MSLHVETLGEGSDLVMLHGWGMHAGIWQPVKNQLAENYRLHLVDLPGMGNSEGIAPYTLENLVDVLSAQFSGGVAVCGWSMGGLVAMQWALSRSQQVHKLALIGATPKFVKSKTWSLGIELEVFRQFAEDVALKYEDTLGRFLALQAYGGETDRASLRVLREHFFERPSPAPDILMSGLNILLDTDLREAISKINIPTLVVHGQYDKLAPIQAGHWLAETLPDSHWRPHKGASHAPFISHPSWFIDTLKEFF